MIRSIQAYRGFAALLVVTFHANLIAGEYLGQTLISQFFSFGHSGVPFFFVLSGFIIFFVHRKDIGQPAQANAYLQKRIIRIYPVYWVVTLAIVPVYYIAPDFGSDYHRDLSALVFSLLLLPQDHYPHLAVAWTLVHEMLFYLLFALLILRKATGKSIFILWMAATVLAVLGENAGFLALTFPTTFFLSIYNALFGMGVLACWMSQGSARRLHEIKFPAFILGNVLFLAAGCIENYWTGRHDGVIALFGLAAFLLVLSAGDDRVERLFAGREFLQLMGNASYSIYLTHFLTVSLLGKVFRRLGLDRMLPDLASWVLLVIIATGVGILFYKVIERPLLNYCRQFLFRRNTNRLQ
jgi:peptidoglycan/LPS O-acetylase OafA/YrhL